MHSEPANATDKNHVEYNALQMPANKKTDTFITYITLLDYTLHILHITLHIILHILHITLHILHRTLHILHVILALALPLSLTYQ